MMPGRLHAAPSLTASVEGDLVDKIRSSFEIFSSYEVLSTKETGF